MSTYTQIIYQIVFSTKHREPVMNVDNRDELYRYIAGVAKNKKCFVYQINGVEDHLHIVLDLHPSIALASLVKDIKISSSIYTKDKGLFKNFKSWQEGYGAFTYSIKEKDRLINYVKNQVEHHKIKTFKDEYIELLKENGVEFDDKYLF